MIQQSTLRAIRAKCIECSNGSKKYVAECDILDCPLHLFRLGKNPNRKGIGNKNISKTISNKRKEVI